MSALLEQPTIKRDRTDSDAPRAKLSNLPYGTDEASVRSFVVSTNVAVTSLLVKNNGRVAIATLPDDAALQAILTLNGSVLGDRPVKVGRYFGAGDRPPAKKATDATVSTKTASTSDENVEVDAAGNVTYTHQGARFAVGVREESVQSLAKDAIASLELFDMTPGARVLVAATSKDADAAIKALREALRDGAGRVQGIDVVGFDTETKPVFVAGRPPNDVALVQLAVRGLIVLVRLDLIGGMPDSLRRLLEDASVLKCGVGCAGDEVTLSRRCPGLDVQGSFLEIDKIAKAKFPNLKACGLRSLVAVLAKKRMSKGQQTKNWEQASYTPAMVRYAANDAAAGLLCLELLCR